jgi:hypothetical protein
MGEVGNERMVLRFKKDAGRSAGLDRPPPAADQSALGAECMIAHVRRLVRPGAAHALNVATTYRIRSINDSHLRRTSWPAMTTIQISRNGV